MKNLQQTKKNIVIAINENKELIKKTEQIIANKKVKNDKFGESQYEFQKQQLTEDLNQLYKELQELELIIAK
jgi:hypothetical protein